jgi:hypothetical protein
MFTGVRVGEGRRSRPPLANAEQLPENCPQEDGIASVYPGTEQPPNAKRWYQSGDCQEFCL